MILHVCTSSPAGKPADFFNQTRAGYVMNEAFFMATEHRDIQARTYLTATEWAAIKQRREVLGLSEAAYLRFLAMADINQSSRAELLREQGFPGRSAPGMI